MDLLRSFFDGSYMPHGHCYLWRPEILWTHVISDIVIAMSYFSIPIMLFLIVRQRKDWQFNKLFILFSLFIFMCGITHILSIATIWHGIYGIHGTAKAITAIVSLATAIALLILMPKILRIPSVAEIEDANRKLLKEKFEKSKLESERESERLFRLSLDATPVGIITLNTRGEIKMANDAFCSLLNFSRAEVTERPLRQFMEDEQVINGVLERLRSATQAMEFCETLAETHLLDKQNARLIPVELRFQGGDYQNQTILIVTIIDLTYRKKAEAAKNYLSAIVESCNDAIIGKDLSGYITHWNRAAEDLYGYSEQEMLGQSILSVVPQSLHQEVYKILDDLNQGKTINNFETIRQRKDGSQVNVSLTISPVRNTHNKVIGASIIARNISERIRAAQEIKLKNQALESSNKELENFAFIASHDLKEPLRKIMSFGKLIRDNVSAELDQKNVEYFGYMLNATERMQSLLDSLLAYSRVTSKGKPFTQVDLNPLLKEVVADLELLIKESNASITMAALPTIQGDHDQLYQLFQNLIGNSLKYKKDDTAPIIDIQCQQESHAILITITDNGIGFEQQYGDQIFEMFKRLHGKHEYQGTGVGLAICRKICERHGGEIWAESELDRGTSVFIRLPNE